MGHSFGAQVFAQVRELLALDPDPQFTVEQRESSLVITPTAPNTFPVTIYDDGDEVMITADRWHGHEDDVLQAAYCAVWLLTPFYRIVQEYKGGLLVAVWTERYVFDGWEILDPVYFLNPEHPADWIPMSGEKYTRKALQQAAFNPGWDYAKIVPSAVLDDRGWPIHTNLGVSIEENEFSIALAAYERADIEDEIPIE